MTIEQIITLINAGYTKDEIQSFNPSPAEQDPGAAAAPVPPAEEAPAEVQAPVAVAAPAPAPVPAPVPAPAAAPAQEPTLADLMQQVAKLTSTIQANAIAQSVLPQTRPAGAEDAIAEIIRPTFRKKE